MKDDLVNYSLKGSNAKNLYEERLVEELLSVQDKEQELNLDSKIEDIDLGKHENRLYDLFYEKYPMKEGKWPSCKEHVELR